MLSTRRLTLISCQELDILITLSVIWKRIKPIVASNTKAISDLRNQITESISDKLKPTEDKINNIKSSLQTRMDTLDGDNKANTLQIVNIQESINIQAEHVKKVDAERQLNAAKAKEDLEAAVADNERAISELRNELDNSIVEKFKPTEDKLNGIDGQVQILNKSVAVFESRHAETVEKFKEVNVITNTIQTQMKEQEQKMVEQSANDLIKIREQLVNFENITTVSNQEIDAVKKQTDNLAGHVENQLANMEDAMDKKINTDIMPRIGHLDSVNQNLVEKLLGFQTDFDGKLKKQEQMDDSLLNKINELQLNNNDNVSSLQNQLADLDSDNKNNIQQIFTLQESINIQSEQVKKVDAERQKEANKTKEDIESTIASNAKAISDLRNELANSIADKFKPTKDKINNIDNSLQDVNKTLAIFDGRHVETVEKMKEMTVITNNIQVQIKAQEQKMIEQSANDLNQIRDQLRDIENQAGLSGQKIQELDRDSQTLQEKVLGMENQVADRLDDLVKSDASIMAKINGLESNTTQNINQLTINLEKKMADTENKIHLEIESVNKQTEDLTNNLEEQLGNIEDVMDKKINTDIMPRIGQLDNTISDMEKDIKLIVASNTKAISDLRNQITESISDKLRPTEDKINNLDATIQDVNKTLAVFEGRHVETVEKMKEVTVLTNNIQLQIKAQEQKMIEQSANDLNQIRDQLRDIENQAGLSDQKIQELNAGSQTLQEKVLGMENQVADRLEDLAKSDASLLAKINGLDTGNQQLLEKLLEVEK